MRYKRILELVKEVEGLGTMLDGDPTDLTGVLFNAHKEDESDSTLTVLNRIKETLHLTPNEWDELFREADSFIGSPKERRDHMLDYLAMKIEIEQSPSDINPAEAEEW